jgi:broad-specificity NMP kinase
MKPRIYFVTGVVGAGKSSLIEPLRARLGADLEIHDFDERGVPDAVDAQWSAAERKYWLSVGLSNLELGVGTVICGFTLPRDEDDREVVKFALLDLDEPALRERLKQRYSDPSKVKALARMRGMTVEESVHENVGSIPWLRGICTAHGVNIIDTNGLTSEQTAAQVADWIRREGNA